MRRWRRIVGLTFALLVSAGLGGLVFFRVQWSPTFGLLPRFPIGVWFASLPVHLPWVAPFALMMAIQPPMRALVWRMSLPHPRPRLAACYHALALGGLVHNLLPGRLGPAGSALVLGRWTAASFTTLLASLLLVKLAELAALMALATGAMVALERGYGGAGLLGKVLAGGLALLGMFAAVAMGAAHGALGLSRALQRRGWPRLSRTVAALAGGLAALRSAARVGAVAAAALIPVGVGAAAFGISLAALDARGGPIGGALLLAAITLGGITPGLPVGMGVYYFVASWGAGQLGLSPEHAAALAALSHAAVVLVHLVLGAASALIHRRSLRAIVDLRRSELSVQSAQKMHSG